MSGITEQFKSEIDKHQMQVIYDNGVNRHIRFKRPGSMNMHFDLITWPGYLCYTGDMGTFVFRRLQDMFQFFRREPGGLYQIDMRYWAEKVEAGDKCDGIERFSEARFRADVRDFFEQSTEDTDKWTAEAKAALWARIENEVFWDLSNEGEHAAWSALRSFDHDKRWFFQDWERSCREYSHRFQWCCHALAWAINTYDMAKASPTSDLAEGATA